MFGMRTGKKSASGKSIYEFDRVSFVKNDKTITGTVLNLCDPWYPEFKVLIAQKNWENSRRPEYVALNENVEVLNTENDDYYIAEQYEIKLN